jgi:AcrR family transcriptional regulator
MLRRMAKKMPKDGKSKGKAARQIQRRLKPDERERLIAQAAVRFFAEHGFEGQTRELARRIGIAQPLLYRYFPSKQALIDRVYREVFVDPWRPEWFENLADRSKPLKRRLQEFYIAYAHTAIGYDRVRLFVLAGLKGLDINARFFKMLRARVFTAVLAEIRHSYHLPALNKVPMTELEAELIWSLHASIFYIGVRRWIYGLKVPENIDRVIAAKLSAMLDGMPKEIARILEN